MQNKSLKCLLLVFAAVAAQAQPTSAWLPSRILGMAYPREAKFARIEGAVRLRCSLHPDGSVADAIVLSGHPVLARSAKANLLQWKFRHAEKRESMAGDFHVTYTFRLQGSCDHHQECKEEFWHEYPDRVLVISEMPQINPNMRIRGQQR